MSGKSTPVDSVPEAVGAAIPPKGASPPGPDAGAAAPVPGAPAGADSQPRSTAPASAEPAVAPGAAAASDPPPPTRCNGAIPKAHRRGSAGPRRRRFDEEDDAPATSATTRAVSCRRSVEYETTPRVNGYHPVPGAGAGAPSVATSTLDQLRLSPCSTTSSRPPPFPRLTPGTSPSPSPALSTDAMLDADDAALLRPPAPTPAPSSPGGGGGSPASTCARRRSSQPDGDRDRLLGFGGLGLGMPFLFPTQAIPLRQEMEEQQQRLAEWTLELNSQIATFRDLLLGVGSARDNQQLREDVRKCRMVTMELCRSARPLIAASHKWAQPGGWTYTMTPAAMWCEFMKMFYRQLSTCHILVHEFPADMSGYQGGALSKLLVQSLRPEWNKQEIASVGVDLQELHECILATGVVTPDEEQHNESSTALQKPSLQRRRSAFSFMFCCTRERDRSPPPPPPPAEEAVVAEAVAEAAAVNGLDLDSGGQGRANANLPDRHEQDPDQDQPAGTGTGTGTSSDEASKAYDPCTPWDSM